MTIIMISSANEMTAIVGYYNGPSTAPIIAHLRMWQVAFSKHMAFYIEVWGKSLSTHNAPCHIAPWSLAPRT